VDFLQALDHADAREPGGEADAVDHRFDRGDDVIDPRVERVVHVGDDQLDRHGRSQSMSGSRCIGGGGSTGGDRSGVMQGLSKALAELFAEFSVGALERAEALAAELTGADEESVFEALERAEIEIFEFETLAGSLIEQGQAVLADRVGELARKLAPDEGEVVFWTTRA